MVLTDTECWDIVQRRDARYDGVFFVGVHTTNIYCRPSCSARPLRKNVRFYPDSQAARAAGLRACLRCHPDNVAPDIAMVHTVVALIEASEGPLSLAAIAEHVHFSTFYVNRTFKKHLGVTPRQYAEQIRQERLRTLLAQGKSVTTAMYDAGYASTRTAYAARKHSTKPRTSRDKGAGMQIVYGCAAGALGVLAVAQTQHGVCFVAYGEDESAASAAVTQAFPQADIRRDDTATAASLRTVERLAASQPVRNEIPLDIRATAFQRRVWDALLRIPSGETQTYGDIAAAIGQPTAVRAVAQACAQNPVAVIVPCHRVVHRDPVRDGYRWGVERKQTILAQERASHKEDTA